MSNYLRRMAAQRVSDHTVEPMPDAQNAEFECQIYTQTWRSNAPGLRYSVEIVFPVMALDAAHSLDVGARQVVEHLGHSRHMQLVENAVTPFDVGTVVVLMRSESAATRDERRARWAAR